MRNNRALCYTYLSLVVSLETCFELEIIGIHNQRRCDSHTLILWHIAPPAGEAGDLHAHSPKADIVFI